MTATKSNPDWLIDFQGRLVRLADPANPERAALAHLRRGLDSPVYALARVGWLFATVPHNYGDAALLAAGLFAWGKGQCGHAQGVNFGAAFGAGLSEDAKKPRERRFVDLVETDLSDLPQKLRQAVSLLARDGVGLDWEQLVRDLKHWDHADRPVQKRWAQGFWGRPARAAATEAVTPAPS